MNAIEKLEAAIRKIAKLSATSTRGPWSIANPAATERLDRCIQAPGVFCLADTTRSLTDPQLIVTLHGAIDPIIAVLGDAHASIRRHAKSMVDAAPGIDMPPGPYWEDPEGAMEAAAYNHGAALALADAILGDPDE